MTGKSVKDVDRYQAELTALLLEEENKYCADCQAKDAPASEKKVTSGSISSELDNNLDFFTTMTVQNTDTSQPIGSTLPTSSTTSSVAENLNLFADPGIKSEDSSKKQLSKDSILSLYGSQATHIPAIPAQGSVYMAPSQIGYPAGYSHYPTLAPTGAMIGGMMAPPVGMMPHTATPAIVNQIPMPPPGYMGSMQTAVMSIPNGIMTSPSGMMGGLTAVPQPIYGVHQAQQLQWNITQVTQQMAGINFYGTGNVMGYSQPMGGGTAQGTNQVLGVKISRRCNSSNSEAYIVMVFQKVNCNGEDMLSFCNLKIL
ncbi:SMAP2 protein, partial [Polypterus senegalus]